MSEAELAEQMHDNPLHWAEKYQALEAKLEALREEVDDAVSRLHPFVDLDELIKALGGGSDE